LSLGVIFEPARLHEMVAQHGGNLWAAFGRDLFGWIFTTLPFGVVVYLLNTIAVLVRDNDRPGAVRIVEQLSDVLRRTLSRHRANEVALEDELDLVRQYLAIEQARFSDRLRPSFEISAELHHAAVPSFALQHLVENAIRHGIAKKTDAGRVTVSARRDGDILELVVTDDGAGIDAALVAAKGHGIENTGERLRALYGERASLVVSAAPGGGTTATLRVPYRELALEDERGPR
jgi:LytS/YehU family sensor histidine kinase